LAKKKKKRNFISHLARFFAVLIGIALVFIPSLLAVIMYFNEPPAASHRHPNASSYGHDAALEEDGIRKDENGGYFIDVRKGESAQSVGLRLERAGLIKNRYFWHLLCRYYKESIKTGTYRLEIPATQIAINRILVSGRQILYRVTIPEGVTLRKAANILQDAGICASGDFLAAAENNEIISRYRIPNTSMEGYLFPDTYLFSAGYPAELVIKSMADNFFQRIEKIDESALLLTPEELNQKVIIASIVEREYQIVQEAPIMAGVFFNRLAIGMALQSCATIEYIITEIQSKPHPSVLYNIDLEIKDPYNTYIKPGLPPGPISAPGAIALEAAFKPSKNDYLFFRLNDETSGRHYFSKTLDEHIKAGQLFTKGRP